MIQYRKSWQNSDRTIGNAVVCRDFVRSVFTIIITHVGDLSPASHR
jgi:hypothetical protein